MSEPQQPQLRKSLRVSDGVALLIGITIGSGIYSTPSIISGYFDSFSSIMVTWVIVGAFVMIGGMIYAELGTRMPATGGEYIYISRCFGPFAGFMFGWAQLFMIRTSAAAGLALIAADYVGFFVEIGPSTRTAIALGMIAAIGVLNYIGVQRASLFQKITTLIKVVGLVVFAVGGVFLLTGVANLLGTTVQPANDLGMMRNLIPALMLIVFTHTGWDRLAYVAGEMKDPRSVIPRSMTIGLALILLIYWAINTVYHSTLGMEAMRATTTPAADVATIMVGTVGAGFVALLVIVSALGSINGTTMASTRVYFAMARDRLFFNWLDYVHPTFRTPSRAILAHCGWAAVILIARGSFELIAAGMVFAILIFYTFTALALFKLRRNETGDENVYRMPFYPWLPAIYLAGVVGLLIARAIFEWEKSLIDFAFVATGLPISYFWLRKRK